MKKYRVESILAPLFKLIEALLDLLVPFVIASIIDNGVLQSDKSFVIRYCILLVGIALIGLAFSVTAQYFAAKSAVGVSSSLRRALYTKIQSLSYTELDKAGTSTLITRLTSDTQSVQSGINMALRLFLRSPFIVIGAVVCSYLIDVKTGLIFTGGLVVLSVVVFILTKKTIPLYVKTQGNLDNVLSTTRESLSGIRVIRAYCNEANINEEFNRNNNLLNKIQIFSGKISAIMNPLTYLLINIVLIIMIRSNAISVDNDILTQGQVIALYNYLSQILVELIKFANLIITTSKGIAASKRISEILRAEDSDPDIDSDIVPEDGSVRFSNVSLTYFGAGAPSLQDIDLYIPSGTKVGVIGGTGSGKTSLVNMIPGFYKASEGDVFVGNHNVKEMSRKNLRDAIGIVPQHAQVFSGTIRDNILRGNENATEEEINDALKFASAYDIVVKKGGLDTVLSEGGSDLSGGQKQRLTIARAAVRKPKILILDDSASALDFATEKNLRGQINSLKDTTAFIVSQRISSVMHLDRIIVIDDGKICGFGTHDELISSCPVYREIYESQIETEVQA